jgi:hypothetical protein
MTDEERIPRNYEKVVGGTTVEIVEEAIRRNEEVAAATAAARDRGDEAAARGIQDDFAREMRWLLGVMKEEAKRQDDLRREYGLDADND